MSSLRVTAAPPAETPIEPAPAEDMPDWLRDIGAPVAAQPPAMASTDLPDWLRDTGAVTPPADTAAPSTFDLRAAAKAEPAAETPDWLSNLQPPVEMATVVSEPSRPETPAKLEAVRPTATAGPVSVDKPPKRDRPAAELPAWLKSLREGQPTTVTPSAEPSSSLLQAEIPTWLEALRPQEGQTGSLADLPAESEQEGAFAGLANILPPLSDAERTEIPAATPVTTVTSADDLARAGIFQELLARPISQPTSVAASAARGRQGPRRLLQWVITLLLLAVIVAPLLMPQGWLPFLPHADNLPPSPLVQAAVDKITILPPNANVLVVFDYDPTQAGEMNQIAEMVLRHLQTRAANVTTVSLNPLGADLAQSVWRAIGPQTPTGGPRIDLGYVPGQAIGVQNVLLNNGPFSLVIDLSASSDSVRWWVEQLAVSGFDVPFIAGVSAAVESLALPYAQSGQITGLISGATGAMRYARQANLLPSLEEAQRALLVAEQMRQSPAPEAALAARHQYQIESQTLAHWLLAALIIIGFIGGLVSRAGRRSAS